MSTTKRITLGTLLIAVGLLASPAAADSPAFAPDAPPATFRLCVQAGIWLRLNDGPADAWGIEPNPLMLTWDVTGFRWDGQSATWGLGARAVVDDLGFRTGPKALVRFPLGDSGKSYFQLAGTWYLFAGDSDLAETPGWGLEAEISPFKVLAFALGFESLRYNFYSHGDAYSDYEATWTTGGITGTYAGVKFNQWTGIAMTAVLFGVAAAAASSSPGW